MAGLTDGLQPATLLPPCIFASLCNLRLGGDVGLLGLGGAREIM
jgi:hypothetical protein